MTESVLERLFIDIVARDVNVRRDLNRIVQETRTAANGAGTAFRQGLGSGAQEGARVATQSTRRVTREMDPLKAQAKQVRNQILGIRSAYIAGQIPQEQFANEMRRLKNEALATANQFDVSSNEFRSMNTAAATAERGLATLRGEASRLGLAHQTQIALSNQFGQQLRTLGPAGSAAALGLQTLQQHSNLLIPTFATRLPAAMQTTIKALTSIQVLAPVALAAGLAAMTRFATQAAETADELDKLSQSVGVNVEAYQELRFVFDQSGIAQDQFRLSMTSFTRRLGEAVAGNKAYADAYKRLGVQLRDTNGDLRDAETLMIETIDALSELPTSAEQASTASKVFGDDVGKKMVPLIKQGADGIQELTERFHELGLGISEQAIRNLVNFKDNMAALQQQFADARVEIAASFVPVLQVMIGLIREYLVPLVQRFSNRMNELSGEFVENSATGAAFRDQISGMVADFLRVTNAVELAQAQLNLWNLEVQNSGRTLGEFLGTAQAGRAWGNRVMENLPEGFRNFLQGTIGGFPSGDEMRDLSAELEEQRARVALLRQEWANIDEVAASAVDDLAESLREVQESIDGYRERAQNATDDTDELGATGAETGRTLAQVWEDLGRQGSQAVAKFAAGWTSETEQLEQRINLISGAIDEAFTIDDPLALETIETMIDRVEELESALNRLQVAEALRERVTAEQEALNRELEQGLTVIPAPEPTGGRRVNRNPAALDAIRGETAEERRERRRVTAAINEYNESRREAVRLQAEADEKAAQEAQQAARERAEGRQLLKEVNRQIERQVEFFPSPLDLDERNRMIRQLQRFGGGRGASAAAMQQADSFGLVRNLDQFTPRNLLDPTDLAQHLTSQATGGAVRIPDPEAQARAASGVLSAEENRELQRTLAELGEEFAFVEARAAAFGEESSVGREKMQLLRQVITDLLRDGFKPTSDTVHGLIGDYGQLAASLEETEEAARREAEAIQAGEAAMAELDRLTGRAPSRFDEMRDALQGMADVGELSAEKLAELNAEIDRLEHIENVRNALEGLRDMGNPVATAAADIVEGLERIRAAAGDTEEAIAGATLALEGVSQLLPEQTSAANQLTEGYFAAGGALAELLTGIPGLGQLGAIVGEVWSKVLGDMGNGLARVREEIEGIAESAPLLSKALVDSLAVTERVSRGSLLGALGFTKEVLVEEATQAGLDIAGGIAQGIADAFNATNLEEFRENLDLGLDQIIRDQLIEALILDDVMQQRIAELAKAMRDALEDGVIDASERRNIQNIRQKIEQEAEAAFEVVNREFPLPSDDGGDDEPRGGAFGVEQPRPPEPQIALPLPQASMNVTAAAPFQRAGVTMNAAAETLLEAAMIIRDHFGQLNGQAREGDQGIYRNLATAMEGRF